MTIEMSSDATNQTIASLHRYLAENIDEPIVSIEAGALLAYLLKQIGPVIYNQAIADAQSRLQERGAELDVEVYEQAFSYWAKARRVHR